MGWAESASCRLGHSRAALLGYDRNFRSFIGTSSYRRGINKIGSGHPRTTHCPGSFHHGIASPFTFNGAIESARHRRGPGSCDVRGKSRGNGFPTLLVFSPWIPRLEIVKIARARRNGIHLDLNARTRWGDPMHPCRRTGSTFASRCRDGGSNEEGN